MRPPCRPSDGGSSISRPGWSPGSRVAALSRAFPFPVASCGWARRSQLRGQLRNWKPGLGPSSPHSHFIPRRVSRRRGTRADSIMRKAARRRKRLQALVGCLGAVAVAVAVAAHVQLRGEVRDSGG